ncbi:MAG TPA: methylated-DNA--[protein]-cysteine S-methyltransferase [Ignavibacteriaceae bacterium]|nr:methylated-DNA--[protein]-cysteine S-methyltransferase [Ignavibacteriaceae bacterium]
MEYAENIYFSSDKIAGIKFDVFSSRKGIRHIYINKKSTTINTKGMTRLHPDDPYMFNVFAELKEYFNLKRKKFDVLLDIKGTAFQLKVWNELSKIPFGKTVSYKTIGKRIGDVKAVRAIGRANGANPVPIVIPCHRVIESSGKLGGYSCGIKIKEQLLELEGSLSLELF